MIQHLESIWDLVLEALALKPFDFFYLVLLKGSVSALNST